MTFKETIGFSQIVMDNSLYLNQIVQIGLFVRHQHLVNFKINSDHMSLAHTLFFGLQCYDVNPSFSYLCSDIWHKTHELHYEIARHILSVACLRYKHLGFRPPLSSCEGNVQNLNYFQSIPVLEYLFPFLP